jgi:carbonic anhydrase
VATAIAGEVHFSYEKDDEFGPSHWGRINIACVGLRQSPIDIKTNSVVISTSTGPSLTITKFDEVPQSSLIKNNGHSLVVKLNYADGNNAKFSGGPLGNDTYIIDK